MDYKTQLLERASLSTEAIDYACSAARDGDTVSLAQFLDRFGLALATAKCVHGSPSMVGNTALHIAVQNNRLDAVQLLLAHGADMEEKNPPSFTALMLAAWNARPEITAFLIAQGASLDAQSDTGRTLRQCLVTMSPAGDQTRAIIEAAIKARDDAREAEQEHRQYVTQQARLRQICGVRTLLKRKPS